MKKILWTVAAVVVAVVVFYMVRGNKEAEPLSQASASPTPAASAQPSAEPSAQPSANEVVVTYTDAGYSPSSVTVKTGTTVTFKNASSRSSWTASGMHPTHKIYPEMGGCLGSKFDACKGVIPGDSWSFMFNVVGTWGYHDHLNPSYRGTVIVQ